MSSIDEFGRATASRYDAMIADARRQLRLELESIYDTAPAEIRNAPEVTRASVAVWLESARATSAPTADGLSAIVSRYDSLAAGRGPAAASYASSNDLAGVEREMGRVLADQLLARTSDGVRLGGVISPGVTYVPTGAAWGEALGRGLGLPAAARARSEAAARAAPYAMYIPGLGTLVNGSRFAGARDARALWDDSNARNIAERALAEQRVGRGFILHHTGLGRALAQRGWPARHLARVAGAEPWTGDDADRHDAVAKVSAFTRSGWRFWAREHALGQRGQWTSTPELAGRVFDVAFSTLEDLAIDWASSNASRFMGVALKLLFSLLAPILAPNGSRDRVPLVTMNWCVCILRDLNARLGRARLKGAEGFGARLGHVLVRGVEQRVGTFLVAEAVALALEDAPGLFDLPAAKITAAAGSEPLCNPDARLAMLALISARDFKDANMLRRVVQTQWRMGGA